MEKASLVLVFNAKNELALQKRSASDDSYPSCWDFSAGGGVDEGEDFETAAIRELKEELGITAPVAFVLKMDYPGTGRDDAESAEVFKAMHDGPFDPDPTEVQEVRFFPINEIQEMVKRHPEDFHPEFVYFVENFMKNL